MKPLALIFCFGISNLLVSQTKPDSLGLPGDNFDLYGALELFKKSATPEAFEKSINSNDNEVNNLDLDGDGKVDYVKVIDEKNKDAHTLILQVDVSATEKQDVAVIEIDKTNTDKAHVQIVGDEALYGKDYIIEPTQDTVTNKDSGSSNNTTTQTSSYISSQTSSSSTPIIMNVWGWPSVQYVYGPSYSLWISPWYWNYYPTWWSPWEPIYWRYHYRRSYHYHYPYYHRTSVYRSPGAHSYYYGRRTTSGDVQRNTSSGFYRERQETYKQHTEPDKKYNNLPAKRENLQMRENNPQPNTDRQPQKDAAPVKDNLIERQPVENAPAPRQINQAPEKQIQKQSQPQPTPISPKPAPQKQVQPLQAPRQPAPQKQVKPAAPQQQPIKRTEAPTRVKPR